MVLMAFMFLKESWKQKIDKAISGGDISNEGVDETSEFDQKVLTIGTIGHPNVGKSSLINSLMGKRVVRTNSFFFE
jgi:ribosome biogenesis GTPase A